MSKMIHIAVHDGGLSELDDLHFFQDDLKSITPENMERLKREIVETGFAFTPHIWGNPEDSCKYILDGHHRVMALKELRAEGYEVPMIPTNMVEAKTIAEARRRVLQASSSYAKITEKGLAAFSIKADLNPEDIKIAFDFPSVDMVKFNEIFSQAAEGLEIGVAAHTRVIGLTDADEVPEVKETGVSLGDVYQLGNHRLVCGDSTDSCAVELLMLNDLADLVFTDPPYGVKYDGGHADPDVRREKLINDHDAQIYGASVPMMFKFSKDGAALYLWFACTKAMQVLSVLEATGYTVRSWIIWNKNMAQFGAIGAQYKQKHEPCLYSFKRNNPPFWDGPTNEVSVWDIARASKNEFHPTQKPVELAERAMTNSCPANGIVLDLFGGSGSTMIAAEKIGRAARLMELDPIYCQTIINRWEAFTGQKAEKIAP